MRITVHVASAGGKRDIRNDTKKLFNLVYRAERGLIHVDHHVSMLDRLSASPNYGFRLLPAWNYTALLSAHTSLDQAAGVSYMVITMPLRPLCQYELLELRRCNW